MSMFEEVISMSKSILPKLEAIQEKIEDSPFRDEFSEHEDYQHGQLCIINSCIDKIRLALSNVDKKVKYQGRLWKNINKRYEVEDKELCTGTRLEVWIEDDTVDNGGRFVPTLLLHSGDYYLQVLGRGVNIEGMLVRVRES